MNSRYTLELHEVKLENLNLVGGKNASLGEMMHNLASLGISIPKGFAITVDAYWEFLKYNNLEASIRKSIEAIDMDNLISLRKGGMQVRQLIRNGKFPEELQREIIERYQQLSNYYNQDATDVAVRSSATAEDLPDTSFAGQQETYLNVRGAEGIMESVRNCFASLFTDRAISYREHFKFDHFDVALSVCVQKMVRSDLASSGVAFSLDTESGFKNAVVINGSYGLGEMIVQGAVSPDEFIVFKPTLEKGYCVIIEKSLGNKDQKMVYGDDPGQLTKIIHVQKDHQKRFCISDEKVLQLAQWVCAIEKFYSDKK